VILNSAIRFLGHDGPCAQAIAAHDWERTSLGPVESWPGELRAALSILLQSDYPAALWWGAERILLHNDYYTAILAERGPAHGRPLAEVWREAVDTFVQEVEEVFASAHGQTHVDARVDILRNGQLAESYWNFSVTPVLGQDGAVLGVFNGVRETTDAVIQRRFDRLMVDLDTRLLGSTTSDEMIDAALDVIGRHLDAKRTGFGEIDTAAHAIDIRRCWTLGDMPDICGRYPLGTFGRLSDDLARGEPVVIQDNRQDVRTMDVETQAIYDRIGLRSGIVVPIVDRGHYVGGLFVQDDGPRNWTPHQIKLAVAATQRLWTALGRARHEAALRVSEQRYRLIFEQAEDIIFTADIDQTITDCNAAGARAIGLSRDQLIGRSIAEFVTAEGFAQTTAMLHQKLGEGGNTRHELAVSTLDGRAMRWENNSTLILDADKQPVGLLSISRDVTQRRAFDERRELLIHELNHRVKNTLSLVQGLAYQSFRSGQAMETATADFLARLAALAVAHDLLTRDQWEGATIAELVAGATAHAAGRIEARGPHVLVSPRSAVALVMALHELTTNAVKYGALSLPGGTVAIHWSSAPTARFAMEWRENGGPVVTAPERRGFGVRMIERALASDLGGAVSVTFDPTGVICTIDGPVLS
jgi:PAS domain S-box-containing protein